MKILVLHGPNLNLLGSREPNLYGSLTLAELDQSLMGTAAQLGLEVSFFQSNAEHELVGAIQAAKKDAIQWIIINAGAYTHTSVALRDALLAVDIPFIEVHLSNVFAREAFRHQSYLSDIAKGVITGLGVESYRLALYGAHHYLSQNL